MCLLTTYIKLNNNAMTAISTTLKKYRLDIIKFEPIIVTCIDDGRVLTHTKICGVTFSHDKLCIVVLVENEYNQQVELIRCAIDLDLWSLCQVAEHVAGLRF